MPLDAAIEIGVVLLDVLGVDVEKVSAAVVLRPVSVIACTTVFAMPLLVMLMFPLSLPVQSFFSHATRLWESGPVTVSFPISVKPVGAVVLAPVPSSLRNVYARL